MVTYRPENSFKVVDESDGMIVIIRVLWDDKSDDGEPQKWANIKSFLDRKVEDMDSRIWKRFHG